MRIAVRAFNDNPGSPVLVFGNALGTRMSLWSAVAGRLADDFQIYISDLPGHTLPADEALGDQSEPYTIADQASGLVEPLAAVGRDSFTYRGGPNSGGGRPTRALTPNRTRSQAWPLASSSRWPRSAWTPSPTAASRSRAPSV